MAAAWIAHYLSRVIMAVAAALLVTVVVLVTLWWHEFTSHPTVPATAVASR